MLEDQIKGWIATIARYVLSGIVGSVVAKGWLTEVQGEEVIVAVIAGVITVAWAAWRKYNIGEKIRLSLALPAGATLEQLNQAVAVKNDPVELHGIAKDVREKREGEIL